jgi:2-succinyl-6-hydroxy-2,4-cyclohexadiene-1-carboxylate synthase
MSQILNHKVIGKGEPLILLHGFLGSISDWDQIAQSLSKNFKVIIPDLPGFGGSKFFNLDNEINYQKVSEELVKLIKHIGISKINVCGYSMGGRVALSLYFDNPDLISKLIIISANPGISEPSERTQRLEKDRQLADSITRDGIKSFLIKWYNLPLFQSLKSHPKLLEELIEKRIKDNDEKWVKKILIELSPGNVPNLWPQLSSIKIPLLYMAGSLDLNYVQILKEIEQKNLNFHTSIIENVGHNCYSEDATSVIKIIENYLL